MDELLVKSFNDLSEEEKKQVQKFLNNKKPFVTFSKATLEDCVRSDGLNLNIDYVKIKAPTLFISYRIDAPKPSAHLCETLARIDNVWVLNNEKACRMCQNISLNLLSTPLFSV